MTRRAVLLATVMLALAACGSEAGSAEEPAAATSTVAAASVAEPAAPVAAPSPTVVRAAPAPAPSTSAAGTVPPTSPSGTIPPATIPATIPPATIPPATIPPATIPDTLPPTTMPPPPTAPAITLQTVPAPLPTLPVAPPPPTTLSPTPSGGGGGRGAGGGLGRLEIPKLGISSGLQSGVALSVLDRGPGHWPGTALPGQVGNVVIAGHRTSHGAIFRHLDKLNAGDQIVLENGNGRFVYAVTGTQIVNPDAMWITGQGGGSRVTLFACHPVGSAAQRIVVFGKLAGT